MKIAAINALIHMDSEKARPILQRVLARRDAASVCLRRKAVFLISQGEDEGAEDILLASARTDPDPEVREQAVFWLSQVGSERAVGALDSILRTSTDRRLQDKAIFALSQQDSPRARQALRTYAERADAPVDLREQAIFWIGQSGGKESAAYLRELFGRIKDEELRNKILFSVSQMGGEENGKWLVGIARDRAQPIEIRKQALFWAGQGGAPIADLTSLYTAFDDREMREQLIFVYSQRDEPGRGGQAARYRPARPRLPSCGRRRSSGWGRATIRAPPRRSRTSSSNPERETAMKTNWWAALLVALLPAPLAAQSLAQRVRGAGDGTVRLSFAAREGVCSTGTGQHHDHRRRRRRRVGERLRAGSGSGVAPRAGRPGDRVRDLRRRAVASRPRPGDRSRAGAGAGGRGPPARARSAGRR